jgi:predicted acetyltransferase
VSLSVRPITSEELVAWTDVMHVAFHNSRPPEPGADFRREVFGEDYSRTLSAFDGKRPVATYESFAAELTLPGGTCLLANAVTAVSVLPTYHRRGALTGMITQDLQAAKERGEAASILIAAEYPIYGRFGFGPATDHAAYRLETAYAEFTHAARAGGHIDLVEPRQLREIAPTIFDRLRRHYPGQIDRRPFTWDLRLRLRPTPWRADEQPPRCALYTSPNGEPEGYLLYTVQGEWVHHVPSGKLEIDELVTVSQDAYLALWRYMSEIDLVTEVTVEMRPVDEPLTWVLANARKALRQTLRSDFLWVRPLDTSRMFETRRYASEERVVFEVDDPLGLAGGRFALEGGPLGASCTPTDAAADLRLGMSTLGAMSLGGISLEVLQAAGRIQEERAGALDRAERLFHWPTPPWCSTFF